MQGVGILLKRGLPLLLRWALWIHDIGISNGETRMATCSVVWSRTLSLLRDFVTWWHLRHKWHSAPGLISFEVLMVLVPLFYNSLPHRYCIPMFDVFVRRAPIYCFILLFELFPYLLTCTVRANKNKPVITVRREKNNQANLWRCRLKYGPPHCIVCCIPRVVI